MVETKVVNGKEYTWENISCIINGVEMDNLVPILYDGNPIDINGLSYSYSSCEFLVHFDQRIYGKLPKRTSKKQLRQLVKRI